MDEDERKLERQANAGDMDARQRLIRIRNRSAPRTIAHGLDGHFVYVEQGPNYAECGLLSEIWLDEIGRGILVFMSSRRKKNEDDAGPTWMHGPRDNVRIPTTAITFLHPAADRWPSWDVDEFLAGE